MDRDKLIEEMARALFSARSWNQRHRAWDNENRIQEFVREDYRTLAQAALSRLEALGLVVVPKVPSEAMVEAGCICVGPEITKSIYTTMLSAAEGVLT